MARFHIMRQLKLPLARRKLTSRSIQRRKPADARERAIRRNPAVYEYQYTFDGRGRRVLVGLTFEETAEFELLELQSLVGAAELRWLELFNKHDRSRANAA
jgi:hypothetical protein